MYCAQLHLTERGIDSTPVFGMNHHSDSLSFTCAVAMHTHYYYVCIHNTGYLELWPSLTRVCITAWLLGWLWSGNTRY
jgi:hypothetical protein